MINYTISDLSYSLASLTVWIIVFSVQGYAVGAASNFCRFRRSCFIRQLGLATIFSLSILPVVYGLVIKIGGVAATTTFAGIALLASCTVAARYSVQLKGRLKHWNLQIRASRFMRLAILAWIGLCLLMVVDLQSGNNLYLPMATYDHSNLVAFTDTVLRTGVPPVNPTYFPGRAIPIFYHYYWVVLSATISQLAGLAGNTRPVIMAGIAYTGVAFINALSLTGRFFSRQDATRKWAPICTVCLLLVWNLYVVIVVPLCQFLGKQFCVMDWWTTDQMGSFLEIMLWCPHHIGGLIAGIMGMVLLLQSGRSTDDKQRLALVFGAGACFASQLGMSIYLSLAFAVACGAWMILCLVKRWMTDAKVTILTGVVAAILSIPFLTQGLALTTHASTSAVHLGIRRFEVIFVLFPQLLQLPDRLKDFIYFLVLPINYFFGWGFIMAASLLWWQRRSQPIEKKHLFLLILLISGVLLGTFVRSSDFSNDLGWRTLLLGNLALTIWAGLLLASYCGSQKLSKFPNACTLLIAIGCTSCIYALSLERTAMTHLYDPDHVLGLRQIYEETSRRLKPQAVVQHNPLVQHVLASDIFALLYSHRQAVCSEDIHGLLNGDNLKEYDATAHDVESLFDHPSHQTALAICKQYKIDVVVLRDTDSIWNDAGVWLKDFPVIAANEHARAYAINPDAVVTK